MDPDVLKYVTTANRTLTVTMLPVHASVVATRVIKANSVTQVRSLCNLQVLITE